MAEPAAGPLSCYHGTDARSALNLLNGAPLDVAAAAAAKIDGPPGFFLATHEADAVFFAVRLGRRPGGILRYDLSAITLVGLHAAGAVLRPIPRTSRSPAFNGDELHVPPTAFGDFDRLRQAGELVVSPAP